MAELTDKSQLLPPNIKAHDGRHKPDSLDYVADTRPLCQGAPFLLTDSAHPRLVLKHGSHFLVMDQSGSIPACNTLGYGYYRYDTRHISQWELSLNNTPLSLLSASTGEGFAGNFLYTNGRIGDIYQQKIIINRKIVLAERLWEQITFENFDDKPHVLEFKIRFQSDFADMFEVRGFNRPERGQRMLPKSYDDNRQLFLAYNGLDGLLLETIIEFREMSPTSIDEGEVTFRLDLPVNQPRNLEICVTSRWAGQNIIGEPQKDNFAQARQDADDKYDLWRRNCAAIETSDDIFNLLLERSTRDLYILRQPTPKGYGLGAGIPWYCAAFGRDSAICAWQVLPFMPDLARDCIQVLAAYQGREHNEFKDEEPGKIMHELRLGELARANQIPHSPYYGTVDATQLWLYLLCQYLFWTGDVDFVHSLWPNVKLALEWLGEATTSGYITYQRKSSMGLNNQGWKDSDEAVIYEDGRLAEPPIAICEAQSYLYACKQEVAKAADLLGHHALAKKLKTEAQELKLRFQKDFWIEQKNYLAMALDRNGNKVGAITSNPGHCLFSGIIDGDKAHMIADQLMQPDLHSGWGIRTLSKQACGYNPVSYHNGTVWPHDNAIIAEGFRTIGRIDDAHEMLKTLKTVAEHEPDFRLPELFCGFKKGESYKPIDYPVSCSPQAWAAGSVFQLLRACLNFQPDAPNGLLHIVEPSLPIWLEHVTIRGLRIGNATLDLAFATEGGSTFCQILRKQGDIKVVIES